MTDPVLCVSGLRRAFGPQPAGPDRWLWGALGRPSGGGGDMGGGLQDIAFDLPAGQALGITGVNGAGKSTLARVLARLAPADAGSIRLLGTEIAPIAPSRFARHPLRAALQMLLQEGPASLPPRQSARALLAETAARFAARAAAPDASDAARDPAQACALAGFDTHLLDRLPHQISQGQAVRLALARALVARPRVLILDEPTAALDATQRAGLMLRLDALRRETGLALIVISHDLHVLRLMCARLIVLDRGRIAEAGPTGDLLATPRHPATATLVAAMARL